MRIISGTLRGRPLLAPRDDRTRPMLEKTRGAIFSILGEAVHGARVLDLYSGTGSLGLEALSRGAASATFVERDRTAFGFLERNLQQMAVADRAKALRAPVEAAARSQAAASADLIFLDPPYVECEVRTRRPALVALLTDLFERVLAPGGSLVLHFPVGEFEPKALALLEGADVREYGRNGVALLSKASS
ncbi:MAG: 16S rRNA (guanine(966)-N(2))-methyltransferase RsmD [Planctomycetes bacterium]|nr:16S rRNA (guanine(966)-N(2))-methyltransferase RsmD [Planctomycetota bacterium]